MKLSDDELKKLAFWVKNKDGNNSIETFDQPHDQYEIDRQISVCKELLLARRVIEASRSHISTYRPWLSDEQKEEPFYIALTAYDKLGDVE